MIGKTSQEVALSIPHKESPFNAAFHQGLHSLQKVKSS